MISEFRTKRNIVKEILGSQVPAPSGNASGRSLDLSKSSMTSKRSLIGESNSSEELSELDHCDSWLMVEKGP